MELKELLAALLLFRANFHNLHWNAVGHDFDTTHKSITSDYYDMCLDAADKVAEMNARLGGTNPNYFEVIGIVEQSSHEYCSIDTGKLYDKQEIVQYSDIMLKGICALIEETLASEVMQDPHNVGIKSSLESMHDDFDLQARYINERRKLPAHE